MIIESRHLCLVNFMVHNLTSNNEKQIGLYEMVVITLQKRKHKRLREKKVLFSELFFGKKENFERTVSTNIRCFYATLYR
jgi:hypothetical protein